MKLLIAGLLGAAVLAAPCAYQPASTEPSPLAGVLSLARLLLP